jgi:uncharacterized OB-fold protein
MAADQLAGQLGSGHVMAGEGGLRLKGGACASCGALAFPKPGICSGCLSEARDGVLYAFSVIHVGRRPDLPYAVGYVDLADSVRVFAELTRTDGLRPDMKVAIEISAEAEGYRFNAAPVEAV